MSQTTTSNYISKIDYTFPIAGQDNDSQGFRSNFTNIVNALNSANSDIGELFVNSVSLNNTNNFGFNTIERAVFQNCGELVYDNSASPVSGNVTIDYSSGSYQKYSLNSGVTNFKIINFPGDLISGRLILSLTTSTNYDTFVNFGDQHLYNLSSEVLPIKITSSGPTIFEIQSDGATGDVFVKKMNDKILTANTVDVNSTNVTGTNIVALAELVLGSNTYKLDKDFNTVVTNSGVMGKIALLPEQTVTTVIGSIGDLLGDNTTSTFEVASTDGISTGSNFSFAGTSTVFTVLGVDNNKISTQIFPTNKGIVAEGDLVIFTNPQFNNQPNLLSMISAAPATLNGAPGNLRGQVYANSGTLYVAYADYQRNTQNWFAVQSAGTTQNTINNVVNSLGTIASQNSSSVNITGGRLANTAITGGTITGATITGGTITGIPNIVAGSINNAGGWAITPAGNKLNFKFNGVTVASLDSSGNFVSLNNVSAFTPP